MYRKIILALAVWSLLAAAILALFVYQASPGPASQDILGVGIGRFENETTGIAFLSGRRLTCAPRAEPPYTSTCTVDIAGQPLTIQAFRSGPDQPNQLGGGCKATYAGEAWPCEIGSRHVHVHWFARISEPLGLDASQMDALRRQYFFENLPEEPFLTGIWLAAVTVTILAATVFFAWLYPPRKRTLLAAAALIPGTFLAALFFAASLTSGFWD